MFDYLKHRWDDDDENGDVSVVMIMLITINANHTIHKNNHTHTQLIANNTRQIIQFHRHYLSIYFSLSLNTYLPMTERQLWICFAACLFANLIGKVETFDDRKYGANGEHLWAFL